MKKIAMSLVAGALMFVGFNALSADEKVAEPTKTAVVAPAVAPVTPVAPVVTAPVVPAVTAEVVDKPMFGKLVKEGDAYVLIGRENKETKESTKTVVKEDAKVPLATFVDKHVKVTLKDGVVTAITIIERRQPRDGEKPEAKPEVKPEVKPEAPKAPETVKAVEKAL